MNQKKNNDLISLVIISYNQENYIKDAILSAFNQDFDNYEIIISDDCSTDNTWNIINETIKKETKRKNIEIILNRNENNLGIVRNYQKALFLTNGNWIVGMAGDDISKPNRLKTIKEFSLKENKIYAIGTGYDLINASGKKLTVNNSYIHNKMSLPLYPGFAAAIHYKTLAEFPEIKENIQSEDIIFSLRALELGKILLTNISTVEHRIHSKNVTSKGTSLNAYRGKINNHINAIKTLEYFKKNELKNKNLVPIIDDEIKKFKTNINQYDQIIFFYRLNFLRKILTVRKIHPISSQKKMKVFYFRIKIFLESYKISAFIFSMLKDNFRFLSALFATKKSKPVQQKTFFI